MGLAPCRNLPNLRTWLLGNVPPQLGQIWEGLGCGARNAAPGSLGEHWSSSAVRTMILCARAQITAPDISVYTPVGPSLTRM